MTTPTHAASIATLQGRLQRRYFKPWKAVAKAIGRADMFRTQTERARLKAAVDFASNICAVHSLDPHRILLKLDDKQRSDGRIVKAVGQLEMPMEILLRPRLFSWFPQEAMLFVLAHEFGHILNGDTRDEKVLVELALLKLAPELLTDATKRKLARNSHKTELATDKTAVSLFPTQAEGIAAGIRTFKAGIAADTEVLGHVSNLIGKPLARSLADFRLHSHPSPQLRIRMLQRLAAQPK